jgi:hypothetical protein
VHINVVGKLPIGWSGVIVDEGVPFGIVSNTHTSITVPIGVVAGI